MEYRDEQLEGRVVALADQAEFIGCQLSGADIISNGYGYSFQGCFFTHFWIDGRMVGEVPLG